MPVTFSADEVAPPTKTFSPDEVAPPTTSFSPDEVKPPQQSLPVAGLGKQIYSSLPTINSVVEAFKNPKPWPGIRPYQPMEIKSDDSIPATVGKEAYNLAIGIPNFIATPAGTLTTVTGGTGGTVARGIGALFSAQAFHQVGEALLSLIPNWSKLSTPEKTKAIVDVGGNTIFGGLMAKAAAPTAGEVLAPKTTEAVKATIATPVPEKPTPTPEKATPEIKAPQIEPQAQNEAISEPLKPTDHVDYTPEDLAKYQELKAKSIPQSMEEFSSPEFQKNWHEFEALRNKYNGNPPRQIVEPSPAQPVISEKPPEVKPAQPLVAAKVGEGTSGFKAPPMPEKFDTLDDALKYRQAYKDAEIEFYKSLGLTDSEAAKFFRAGDNRSNVDVSNLEDKLTSEQRERLDAFSTGEGQPVYQWDRQYNPENLAGETNRKTLADHVVSNLSRESAPTDFGDKLLHAAVALRQLKENGGTWSDVARALDSYTTKISGSQGDKAFAFKKYGEEIRKFSTQQGIDLPQGEFGAKIGAVTPLKQISTPPPPAVTTGKVVPKPVQSPVDVLNTAKAVTVTLPEDATMFQVSHKKGQWSEPMSPDTLSKAGKGKVANTMQGTDPIAIRGVSVGKGKTVKVSKGKVDVQEFVGLGAAAEGEVGTGGGADIYGIAQAAREARAKAGQVAEVPTGEGITAPDSVEHGRELLSKGADPEKSLSDFERTKKLSADDMALVRAKGEELSKAARSIEEKFGTDSNEYRMAWKALSDWDTRTKPMQTEWHKIGEAQQGATDIDTGTFTGLQRAYKESSGKEFTPTQVTEAKKIAKKTQLVAKETESAKQRLLQQLELELGKVDVPAPKNVTEAKMLFSKFAEGKNFTPQQIKTLWNAAKKFYLEKGVTDFDDIRNGLATDFGLPVNDVSRALAQPKGVKRITDEMYSKMSQQRALQNSAKSWLKNTAMPGWLRFARGIPRIFFTTKILGHGTVGMITHAGNVMFNPWAWKVYWPTFLKQYKLMYNSAYHERLMQDLMRSPNYVTARRGGLANNPFSYTDDYQNPAIVQYLGKIGLVGNRGFDSLKLLRQGVFDLHWDKLPNSLKTPEMAKLLSDSANHMSGIVKMSFREWAGWSFFAPKLEGSRWAWMIGDPYKAAKTFKEWKTATPEERVFAVGELKQKATVAGVYFSLLAINQGMLSSMNSDQKINFDNPRRGDFLAFKVAGHNLGIISPMIGMVKLFSNLVHDSVGTRSKLEQLSDRSSEFGTTGISYIRGKSSPFTSFAWDIASQADFQGRPLPFSKDKTPAWLRKQGYKKFTYPEYAAEEFTPIPVEEAIKEVWKAQGMNDNQIATYMKAITVAGIMGGTGARLSEDTHKTKP